MPADFATLKKHGLTCAMVSFPTGKTLTGTTVGTIRENYEFISHYHTGGCPGRNEIDETQELFYPAIMRTIAATGYRGFVGQEFIPTAEDALSSLKKAMEICTI